MNKNLKLLENENKFWRMKSAPLIKDAFPEISSLDIEITFVDPDDGATNNRTLQFTQESKAIFSHKCPHRECVQGGYDFSDLIVNTYQSKRDTAESVYSCQGWQDENRFNKHRCMLEATFKANIYYRFG